MTVLPSEAFSQCDYECAITLAAAGEGQIKIKTGTIFFDLYSEALC